MANNEQELLGESTSRTTIDSLLKGYRTSDRTTIDSLLEGYRTSEKLEIQEHVEPEAITTPNIVPPVRLEATRYNTPPEIAGPSFDDIYGDISLAPTLTDVEHQNVVTRQLNRILKNVGVGIRDMPQAMTDFFTSVREALPVVLAVEKRRYESEKKRPDESGREWARRLMTQSIDPPEEHQAIQEEFKKGVLQGATAHLVEPESSEHEGLTKEEREVYRFLGSMFGFVGPIGAVTRMLKGVGVTTAWVRSLIAGATYGSLKPLAEGDYDKAVQQATTLGGVLGGMTRVMSGLPRAAERVTKGMEREEVVHYDIKGRKVTDPRFVREEIIKNEVEALNTDSAWLTSTNPWADKYVSPGNRMSQFDWHLNKVETAVKTGDYEFPSGPPPRIPIKKLAERPYQRDQTDQVRGGNIRFDNPASEARWRESRIGRVDESIKQKLKKAGDDIWKGMTGGAYPYLPRTAEYANLRVQLSDLARAKIRIGNSVNRTVDALLTGLNGKRFGPNQMDVFVRKIVLDDFAGEVAAGQTLLPFGLNSKSLLSELAKINKSVELNEGIARAVKNRAVMWTALKADYIKAASDVGVNVAQHLTKENYFHHMVLDYAMHKSAGLGSGGVKVPTRRYLKKRKGTEDDINTNYFEAEMEIMQAMHHDIAIFKTLAEVKKFDISAKLKLEAGKTLGVKWEDIIPDTHVKWQAKEGTTIFMADTISATKAANLRNGILEEVYISAKDINKVRALGGKQKELVIPKDVAKTLDNFIPDRSSNWFSAAHKRTIQLWKVYQLISPRKYLKYNIRNLTGDADAVFAGNPQSFRYAPGAVRELFNYFFKPKKPISPELQEFLAKGGYGLTFRAQEMVFGEANTFGKLTQFADKFQQNPTGLARKAFDSYWKYARITTDMRELVLRYASFKSYGAQIRKNRGKPDNYGASSRVEVDAIRDWGAKAFKLSEDLLGAYGDIGLTGQILRSHMIPFFSWKEVNLRRYAGLVRNAKVDGNLSILMLKKLGISAPLAVSRGGIKVAKFLFQATAFWSALHVWNTTRYPELENKLSDKQKNVPHIIFGQDNEGKIRMFSGMGALRDVLQWFGLDAVPHLMSDWVKGKRSLTEVIKEMSKSPVNMLLQGVEPISKTLVELMISKKFYPDAFSPRTIRDKGHYVWRTMALGDEYAKLFGKPSQGYLASIQNLYLYKIDPNQGAYFDIQDEKRRLLLRKGKQHEGFFRSHRGDAFYNLKLAIRYKDKEMEKKYANTFASLVIKDAPDVFGIIRKDPMKLINDAFDKAIKQSAPLAGLSKKERIEFVESLDVEDKKKYKRAIEYYNKILRPDYTMPSN
jgi:hypothetical protein